MEDPWWSLEQSAMEEATKWLQCRCNWGFRWGTIASVLHGEREPSGEAKKDPLPIRTELFPHLDHLLAKKTQAMVPQLPTSSRKIQSNDDDETTIAIVPNVAQNTIIWLINSKGHQLSDLLTAVLFCLN